MFYNRVDFLQIVWKFLATNRGGGGGGGVRAFDIINFFKLKNR